MSKKVFNYKGRDVEALSIDKAGGGQGFGLLIDGVAINRGGYDGSESADAAIADGVAFAKEYIDSLP